MKRLEPGTTKYLRLNPVEIELNVRRAPKVGPIVHVIEVVGDSEVKHIGYGVLAEGPVSLTYSQRTFAGYDGREGFHAALTTVGAVVIAETPDEPLVLAEKAVTPTKTAAKKEPKNG